LKQLLFALARENPNYEDPPGGLALYFEFLLVNGLPLVEKQCNAKEG